ncbi:MAG: CPBP family intramembrane metalloprotease, partial [Lachnospiraceae bacterium]|nr:CPBP family intramembrane metalloprotease [Lachnospiraceae bacterium]
IKKQGKVYNYQIFITAIIFGAGHIYNYLFGTQDLADTIAQMIFASLMGIILGILYVYRGRNFILLGIIHGLWDATVTLLSGRDKVFEKVPNLLFMSVLIGQILFLIIFVVIRDKRKEKKMRKGIEKGIAYD